MSISKAHTPRLPSGAVIIAPYWTFIDHASSRFPEMITDDKGKERKKYRYKDMKTPYEKFKSIPDANQYLKACMTFEQLDAQAAKMSDSEARLGVEQRKKKVV